MWVGLAHGQAGLGKYLMSPFLAAPLTVLAGIGMASVAPLLSRVGISPHGMVEFALGTAFSTLLGYSGGRAAADDTVSSKVHERGALVDTAD